MVLSFFFFVYSLPSYPHDLYSEKKKLYTYDDLIVF